jgi:outer membrane biosynthesis protein TonB
MDGPVPAVRDVNTTALSTVSVKKEIDRRVEGGGDKSSRKGEASNGTKLTGGSRGETVPTREDRIGGEVKNRRVIYRPKPPGLDLESDVTIVLKFTVLPNGQVDQISPFTRADSRLERVAIELLSKYRFEPLFGSQKIQRGVIPFTIYRKR